MSSSHNKKTQVFQCFVCDQLFTTYTEFKTHITTTHTEGREFVMCPLARCNCPVRDLKTHFQKSHPSEKVPKGVQMRAIVFRDLRDASKQRKTPRFKQGTYISAKNGNKPLSYKSGYEREVYELLEKWRDVMSYEVEPFAVEYYLQGKSKHYWPDLRIRFTDGRIEIWEIKPHNQIHLPMNKAKWAFCEDHCVKRGWKFQVVVEADIQQLRKQVLGG